MSDDKQPCEFCGDCYPIEKMRNPDADNSYWVCPKCIKAGLIRRERILAASVSPEEPAPPPHRWETCEVCGPMVRCGYCGNNCCNGGSGENCPDKCASAYALQKLNNPAPPSNTENLSVNIPDTAPIEQDFEKLAIRAGVDPFQIDGSKLLAAVSALRTRCEIAERERDEPRGVNTVEGSDEVRCSFCGKGKTAQGPLIQGPKAFICRDCVDLSVEILAEKNIVLPQVAAQLSTSAARNAELEADSQRLDWLEADGRAQRDSAGWVIVYAGGSKKLFCAQKTTLREAIDDAISRSPESKGK